MAYGDIPIPIKQKLASERIRMYHAVWHFVRNKNSWDGLPAETKKQLKNEGWEPPRFEATDGAGLDFLYMHHRMIRMVDSWMQEEGHHHGHGKRKFVVPWLNVPWSHQDPVWPMPQVDLLSNPEFLDIFGRSKDPGGHTVL